MKNAKNILYGVWLFLDGSTGVLLIIIVLLIGMSAFFSASEMAISSASRVRIKNLADDGNKKAEKVLWFIENFDKSISGILIGNNIVNISASSICTYIATKLWGVGGVGIATAAMTVLIIIFGEILPKSAAKKNAENFACGAANTLNVVIKALSPVAILFSGIKGAISRNDDEEDKKPSITEEELKVIIEEVMDEGVLEKQESKLAKSALEFDEIKVREVLTPRVNVVAIDADCDIETVKSIIINGNFTRIPVYEENLDNVIGILHEKDFLAALAQGKNPDIKALMKEVMNVPDNVKISKVLAQMQKTKNQMAVVIDQYGGTAGIVTMEDILEELVGEIWDEHDVVLQMIVPVSHNKYIVNGAMNIDDLLEEIGYDGDEIESSYTTVGGWATQVLGKIPEKGESFETNGLKITIDSVKENKVSQVIAEYNKEEE